MFPFVYHCILPTILFYITATSQRRVSRVRLSSGYDMPLLGLGLGHYKNETEVEEMVLMFLELGGRHIDTAIVYVHSAISGTIHASNRYENQGAVGRAVKKSGIPREEVFITSKIPPQRMGYDSTFKAILEIVEEIDLGYIDMILIHWPSLLETTLPCRKEALRPLKFTVRRSTLSHPAKRALKFLCYDKGLFDTIITGTTNDGSWKHCRLGSWAAMEQMVHAGLVGKIGYSTMRINVSC